MADADRPKDFFISYAHEDRGLATKFADLLREQGCSPWLDVWNLRPGDDWKDEIQEAIDRSKSIVVLVTPNSLRSPWVNRELNRFADEHGSSGSSRFLPVVIGNPTLPSKWSELVTCRAESPRDIGQAAQQLAKLLKHWPPKAGGTQKQSIDADELAEEMLNEFSMSRKAISAIPCKVTSGNAKVVASGTAISFNGAPIEIEIGADSPLAIRLIFEESQSGLNSPEIRAHAPDQNTLELTLRNFDNPIGTGTTKPLRVATISGREAYLHFRVFALPGSSDKTVHFSIFVIGGVEEGEHD